MPPFRFVLCVAVSFFVLACLTPCLPALASSGHDATRSSQNTSLMQQMDHQRRMNDERRAQAEKMEDSEIAVEAQEAAVGMDYALIAIVASTGLVFFVICRRRGGSTRQCLARRRPRFQPPSRN